MFESLFVKVAMLFVMSMLLGGAGAWFGRNIRGFVSFIVLAVLFIGGTIGVLVAAHASPMIGICALAAWSFVSGLVIGPAVAAYSEELGWETVCLAFYGTGGAMAVCGAIGAFSGINFGAIGGLLTIVLFGLIIFGVISAFVVMSRRANIFVSIIGIIVFSLYFMVDFFRLAHSENTWENAIQLAMSIYLDFINLFLYILQLWSALHKK